jgi:RNA polymerase sigma-70 factor, ECF subfamily
VILICYMISDMDKKIFKASAQPINKDHDFLKKFNSKKKLFNELVNIYKNDVFTFLSLLLGDKEKAKKEAEKLFVKTYYRISKFKDSDSFKVWLYKEMYFIGIKNSKKEISDIDSDSSYDLEYFDLEGDGTKITQERYNLKNDPTAINNFNCIVSVFHSLEIEMRVIVILKDILYEDINFISKVLDISIGTIKSRLAKGRHLFANKSSDVVIESRGDL